LAGFKLDFLPKYHSSSYQIYRFFWEAVDFVYPPSCAGCEKPGELFCRDCKTKVNSLHLPICEICGYPILNNGVCPDCQNETPPYAALRSWAEYTGPLRKALHRLKYKNDLGLGMFFSLPLIQIIYAEKWDFDFVIPIPISKSHRKTRGYNQAALIAKPISLALGRPMFQSSVARVKETQSQIDLSRAERFKNLQSAFSPNSAKLLNKKVLLVDDIVTTGATMISCAQTLREAGCSQVYCISVARTLISHQRAFQPDNPSQISL